MKVTETLSRGVYRCTHTKVLTPSLSPRSAVVNSSRSSESSGELITPCSATLRPGP